MNTAFLDLNRQSVSIKTILVMMIVAYSFSCFMRFGWINDNKNNPPFKWNNEVMINTNDGYYYAQGAKDILNETKLYAQSPTNTFISKLTALTTKILPVSLDTVILYMPIFLSSFLIVPIIFMGIFLRLPYVGFIASLVASITWSYYNRTMAGYYDTDMLIVVWPTLVLFALMGALIKEQYRYLILVIIFIALYTQWHGSGSVYNIALTCMAFLYTIVFERKNMFFYKVISILLISSSSLGSLYSIPLSLAIISFFKYGKNNDNKIVWSIFTISCLIFLYFGGFSMVWSQLQGYVFRVLVAEELPFLKFYGVINTVREAGQIPFYLFANRISGSENIFMLASIGVIIMFIRNKIMLLSIPLIAIGFIALKGGLRFTVFAIPIYAMGISYLIFLFTKIIDDFILKGLDNSKYPIDKIIKVTIISILTYLVLMPNIKHIDAYKVPTVFQKPEVEILTKLDKITSSDDYIISWWDYGYPIRYYANAQTLIDGGAHSGSQNFTVSLSLTKPLLQSVNMLRLDVEYREKELKEPRAGNTILNMITDYKYKNSKDFLRAINSKDFKLPKASRDIYLYLPYRMMSIFPTVALFSELDLENGNRYPKKIFYTSRNIKKLPNNMLDLGSGIKYNLLKNTILMNGQEQQLKNIVKTKYNAQGRLQKSAVVINPNSKLNLIYLMDYKMIMLVQDELYYSTYVQLFALENYDPELVEPVILSPNVKVYKLKR
jgi:dolichyl-diphosphooligosaccharide--protein glycosyltransferase/undecaprenyl-diphosphooligosaccharide--protein glycosyltransferase